MSKYDQELSFNEDLSEFLAKTSFQGFDPQHIRNIVEKNRTIKISDIAKAISFGLNRGTNLEKILSKSSDEGKQIIRSVMDKINVVSTGGIDEEKSTGRDVITLSRLMAAYPVLTCTLNCRRDVRKLPVTTTLHVAFQWFGAGSVIPLGDKDMALWESWYDDADRIINPVNRKDPSKFIDAIKSSKILSAEERVSFHRSLKSKTV